MNFVSGNMIIDHALQQEVVGRAIAAKIGDVPAEAASDLGEIILPDGRDVRAYVRHAAEVVVVDDHGHIVLITRKHNPGAGYLGLVGGFMDVLSGADGKQSVENVEVAALREAAEETGISEALLKAAEVTVLGARHYNRPFDIRQAWSDFSDTGIRAGDLFLVSTRTVIIKINQDLQAITLQAGDDARDVLVARIKDLTSDQFGVADHFSVVQSVLEAM